jgi:hypothetical protein
VSGVIRLVVFEVEDYGFAGRIEFFDVVFVENGVADDVLFRGPVAEVAVAAALAAEGEVDVLGGVGGSFADWAFVLHVRGPWFRNFRFRPRGEVYIKLRLVGILGKARTVPGCARNASLVKNFATK